MLRIDTDGSSDEVAYFAIPAFRRFCFQSCIYSLVREGVLAKCDIRYFSSYRSVCLAAETKLEIYATCGFEHTLYEVESPTPSLVSE